MTSNEELDSQVNKLKEELEELRRETGRLESQLEKAQSTTTDFQMKQIELETRLQIKTQILAQTKKLLIESTMRERNLSTKTEEQSNQETETKQELKRQVESLEEQIVDYRRTEKNHRSTKAALEAETGHIRESLDHEKDREQKLYVVIEQLLKKVFDPRKEELSSVNEPGSIVYEQIIEDFRSMETDTKNDDKEELWIWLKAALQTAGLWEKLTRDDMIEDILGKTLPAKKVVTLSIEYISNELIELGKEHSGADVTGKDFAWTFSVPATWSDAAKQFMREAATEAQLEAENVSIALDMESASVFCKETIETNTKSGADAQISSFSPGTKYIIIDAGAGKIEMTVYEVVSSGKLHEVHTAMGHKMGGNEVNDAFKHILEETFGIQVCEKFLREETASYLDLWAEFEEKKKALQQDTPCSVVIQIPSALVALAEQKIGIGLKNIIRGGKYASDIDVCEHELSFNHRLTASLFEKPIKETVAYVKAIMDKMEDVKAIVMVGGFSASPILQNAVKSNFPEVEVINPDGDAVAAGTVIVVQNPQVIEQRVLKKTYGVDMCSYFLPIIHLEKKRMEVDGIPYCKDLFSKHVRKGQTITVGEVQKGITYTPLADDHTSLGIVLFASDETDPLYIDDAGCSMVGMINIDLSDVPGTKEDKEVKVALIFSETEIKVKARVLKTGKSVTGICDFLG